MNGLIGNLATLAILLFLGCAIGLLDRSRFAPRWLLVAALLVAMNDALLTGLHGLLPDMIGGSWNWQGKLLAITATLTIAALPAFGWRHVGLTLAQAPASLRSALAVAAIYCGLFVIIALLSPDGSSTAEDYAFQLTMPGLEEELFYRGILLFALDRAFTGRRRFLGVDWGWGAVLSCLLFGLAHAFGYSADGFTLDPMVLALTAIPSLVAVWIRLRTASLVLPVLLHNLGNTIPRLF